MTKIIFDGEINGVKFSKEFDNFEDYNKYMKEYPTEIDKTGQSVVVKGSTQVVDDNRNEISSCDCNSEESQCRNLVPFFEADDEYYLDNPIKIEDVKMKFDAFNQFVRDGGLDDLCRCEMNNYKQTLTEIKDEINDDYIFARQEINKIQESKNRAEKEIIAVENNLKLLQKRLDTLKNELECDKQNLDVFNEYMTKIKLFDEFYSNLLKVVASKLEQATCHCNESCQSCQCCQNDKKEDATETTTDQLRKELLDLVNNKDTKESDILRDCLRLLRSIYEQISNYFFIM